VTLGAGKGFGAGLLGHISQAEDVHAVTELARQCEGAGLKSFWVADQRWMRDVYVTLAHAAAATTRINVGTRVTDPYVRHPALTAAALATLAEASHGRAILGIGAGGSGFAQMGIERTQPAKAVREAVTLIRDLWSGRADARTADTLVWGGGQLGFPVPFHIPIVIASRSPLMLRLAGEVADGAIAAVGASANAVEWALDLIGEGEARAEKAKRSTAVLHMTYIAINDDRDAAREAAKVAVVGAVIGTFPRLQFMEVAGAAVPRELIDYLGSGGRDRRVISGFVTREMVEAFAVAGTLSDCIARVEVLFEAGVDQALLTPIPGAGDTAVNVLRRALDHVVPAFN
jgi:5,10-methylenetetrahydromethanopterin reductase